MGRKVELTGIYIDVAELRKLIFEASYDMTKKDRIIWVESMIRNIGEVIKHFVLAYEYQDERDKYTRKLVGDFAVVKADIRTACEFGIFKGNKKDGELVIKKKIFNSLGRIDDSVGKWVNSRKGRVTSGFEGCDSLT